MPDTVESTVKLQSRYWNDLSLELNATTAMASPSLRRRVAPLRLRLPARREVDICKHFEMDADAAEALVRGSPQVKKWASRGLLAIVRIDPPPPEPEPTPELEPTVEIFGLSEPVKQELTRKELSAICAEHDITVSKRWNKAKIREKLAEAGVTL